MSSHEIAELVEDAAEFLITAFDRMSTAEAALDQAEAALTAIGADVAAREIAAIADIFEQSQQAAARASALSADLLVRSNRIRVGGGYAG